MPARYRVPTHSGDGITQACKSNSGVFFVIKAHLLSPALTTVKKIVELRDV